MDKSIAKAQAETTKIIYDHTDVANNSGRGILLGYHPDKSSPEYLEKYHNQIKICRWFYKFDPIASTVVNRMADMSVTVLRNRRKTKLNKEQVDESTLAYYDALLLNLQPFLKWAALEYLLHGLVVPAYTFTKKMGNRLSEKLGRTRYTIIDSIWIRNPDNIELRRKPLGMSRSVYLKIPQEDIAFVQNKGIRNDGTEDKEAYQYLLEHAPEYVAAINVGKTTFLLEDVRILMRKITSYADYPTPFLVAALGALRHKANIKAMDKSIASRTTEMIRHIKVGDKDFPADDDDITAVKNLVVANTSTGERVYNLFTNHTVRLEWVYPPLEALTNEAKYMEPNADIFLAMGFPRVLTTGETQRSNASDSKIASLGPKATLEDLRDALILWLKELYQELADLNGFKTIPEPYFAPIATTDYTALVQFSIQALQAGAISKNTVAQLYGSDYDVEADQIESEIERGVLSPAEQQLEKQQQFTRENTKMSQDFTRELQERESNNSREEDNE